MNEELESEFEIAIKIMKEPIALRNEILNQTYDMNKSALQQYKTYQLDHRDLIWKKEKLLPQDLVAYQRYLPWIFDRHKGYQKMALADKITLIESMFLGMIFPRIEASARIHLVRELVRLNCEEERISPVAVFESEALKHSGIESECFATILDYDAGRCAIAVNQKLLRQRDAHGIYYLEYIYHELDHVYVARTPFQEQTPRDICASILSMRFVNQFKLMSRAKIIYLFLPEEYHAIHSSYRKVSRILSNNPYAAPYDWKWEKECLKMALEGYLKAFNIKNHLNYSKEDMRLLIEDYLFYDMMEKFGDEFVAFLKDAGRKEEIDSLQQASKKYRSIFQKGNK